MSIYIKKLAASIHLPTFIIALLFSVFMASSAAAKEAAVSQETRKFLGTLSNALAEVADAVRPAVVNISTTSIVTTEENPLGGMFEDPFFRHFFGDQFGPNQKRKYKSSALGSGVIVNEDGYVLTNNHVVKGADEIKVILYDKREFKGKIVGVDPRTDLAVIKINAKNLPMLTFGASSKLKTGDVVLAVGNPFGLGQTVTMGIISAVGRSNIGLADFEDFIQTDAAINPGNSGGALVNGKGELIGINTAIFSTSGGYMGIGFAIPSDMAKSVMDNIIKHGKVVRGWLGVNIQNLTADLAQSLSIKQTEGALIAGVEAGGPADKAGLKRGDVVIEMNGKRISDVTVLRNTIASTAPGTTVDFKIIRDGKEMTITVTLGEYKEKRVVKKAEYDNLLKGVTIQELTASQRDKFNLPEDAIGVVVTAVSQESPSLGALQVNDVIQEVNRTPISSAQDFENIVSKISKQDAILLLVYREGGSLYITLRP